METIAVIGAGNGGFATAADLALGGACINLFDFPEYRQNIEALYENKTIVIDGHARTGKAILNIVTSNIAEAVNGAHVILITTHAASHERIAKELAPLLVSGQNVFYMPGAMGSIYLYGELKKLNKKDIILAEVITLPYAVRKTGADSVTVHRRTGDLGLSAMPAKDTEKALGIFQKYFPLSHKMKNILEIALCNSNVIAHPIPTLFGASAIEHANGTFNFYGDGHSPCVDKAIEALDKELGTLLNALGCDVTSPIKVVEKRFAKTSAEIQKMRTAWNITTNIDKDMRFISEDVQECLIFNATLGKQINIPTPITDSLICLLSLFGDDVDFYATGRTTTRLGIGEMSIENLNAFLQDGSQ